MDILASTTTSTGSLPAAPNAVGDTPPRVEEQGLSREAYAMLAQANLLRMRGRWPEAIEKCMAALRLSPDHPSAQSLLGDIYENQGRLDDAIQWYRMALDVQPDSPADRIKLARLLDLKSRDLVSSPVEKTPAAPVTLSPSASPSPMRRLPSWKTDPDRLLRRVATFTGLLAVVIILAALVATHHATSLPFLGTGRQVTAPPVFVPSVTPTPTPDTSTTSTASLPADPSEGALLSGLQSSPSLHGLGLAIVSAEIDPRAGRLTLTISCQPPAGSVVSRDELLRQATRVLQSAEALGDPQTTPQSTVRCLLASPGGGSTPLVFTADTSRAAIAALNPNLNLLTADQLAAAYTNLWWAPTLPQ